MWRESTKAMAGYTAKSEQRWDPEQCSRLCTSFFTNESLLHKMHTKPANLTSFESFVASLSIDDSERSDVLTSLSTIEIGDYLPAVESTPPAPSGDGDDSDDVASDGDDDEEDDDEEDDDYVYLKDAEVPDGFEAVVMAEPPTYIPNDAIDSHYIMLCCDDLEWMLGKIIKMNKSTARLQLNECRMEAR